VGWPGGLLGERRTGPYRPRRRVHTWLSREAYWLAGRSLYVVARSSEHSLVLGRYGTDGAQVAFARVVTDRSTFGWLCEVFVSSSHEGKGLASLWSSEPSPTPIWPVSVL